MSVDRTLVLRALTNLFDNADTHGGVWRRGPGRRAAATTSTCSWPTTDPASTTRTGNGSSSASPAPVARKAGTRSGLGLSIVERIVRNHGGSVWCASRPDGGACFVLRLPVVEDPT